MEPNTDTSMRHKIENAPFYHESDLGKKLTTGGISIYIPDDARYIAIPAVYDNIDKQYSTSGHIGIAGVGKRPGKVADTLLIYDKFNIDKEPEVVKLSSIGITDSTAKPGIVLCKYIVRNWGNKEGYSRAILIIAKKPDYLETDEGKSLEDRIMVIVVRDGENVNDVIRKYIGVEPGKVEEKESEAKEADVKKGKSVEEVVKGGERREEGSGGETQEGDSSEE